MMFRWGLYIIFYANVPSYCFCTSSNVQDDEPHVPPKVKQDWARGIEEKVNVEAVKLKAAANILHYGCKEVCKSNGYTVFKGFAKDILYQIYGHM